MTQAKHTHTHTQHLILLTVSEGAFVTMVGEHGSRQAMTLEKYESSGMTHKHERNSKSTQ